MTVVVFGKRCLATFTRSAHGVTARAGGELDSARRRNRQPKTEPWQKRYLKAARISKHSPNFTLCKPLYHGVSGENNRLLACPSLPFRASCLIALPPY